MANSRSAGGFKAKREFGNRLRALRGRQYAHVVGAAVNQHASQITRFEKGERTCSPEVLDRLIDFYQPDEEETDNLKELARQIWDSEAPWWDEFRAVISASYEALLQRETDATRRLDYHTVLIPAHLQTEDYSRSVTATAFASLGPDQVEDLVAVRTMRQRRLYEAPQLSIYAVLTEAALRFEVGGREAHRAQLAHLLELMTLTNVLLRVIPYGAGAGGTQASAFNILQYDEPEEPDVAFVHNVIGPELKTDQRITKRLNRLFTNMANAALSAEDSRELITTILRELD
ncbi:helix-turn-helix domain-containing protein [Embleya sp. AB8]|uniref:helix-turn-helix domain-containing protein n=1 Tax=Embleya sp. AB8 TaxID=3156304 RepID=UPI003C77DC5C